MHTSKTLISIAILCIMIFGTAFYTLRLLSKDSEKLESFIDMIEISTQNGNWATAENHLSSLKTEWHKAENAWAVLLDHIEIDNIDTSIMRVSKYVETRNVPMALSEIAVLKQYIKHIPEKESFSLKNVF
ncbi:MAG: DUF4363 family protein [Clostridium sp.]|nr:DUF4363 family protein [Clostridium sp.]